VLVAAEPTRRLTPREHEIAMALEEGLSYKLVAARYGLSVDTVKNHIRAIYRKLEINSKGELLALALKRRS
jgi:DNA-binding CsgD family transcriptional regulator